MSRIVAVFILGKHWRDQVNGNSYVSSRTAVVWSDSSIDWYRSRFESGGSVEQFAFETLLDHDVLWGAEGQPSSKRACREYGLPVEVHVFDVTKREAIKWGEPAKEEG